MVGMKLVILIDVGAQNQWFAADQPLLHLILGRTRESREADIVDISLWVDSMTLEIRDKIRPANVEIRGWLGGNGGQRQSAL